MVALIENPTYVSLSKIPNHLIAEMIDGKPYVGFSINATIIL